MDQKSVERIESKVDRLDERLDTVDKHLEKYNTLLDIHIKRTEKLEKRLDPIEMIYFGGVILLKALGIVALCIGIVAGVLKLTGA